ESLEPDCSLERDVFPSLAQAGRLLGVAYDGYFVGSMMTLRGRAAKSQSGGVGRRRFLTATVSLTHDGGHVGQIERIEGAQSAVKTLNDAGLFVFVVTNQAGVARGFYTEDDVGAVHADLTTELAAGGAHFDDIRYCPYQPDASYVTYRRVSDRRK